MNTIDLFRLIFREYRNGKREWILSFILQVIICVSVLFVFTIVCDLDYVCGAYMKNLYPNGFPFNLKGYGIEDTSTLSEMGFYDLSFSNIDKSGYGIRDSLDGIWIHKISSAFNGKDIWNSELDEILCVVFFCQIMLGIIGISLVFLMINNLSNSFAMKIARRENYMCMMSQLGCPNSVCWNIFFLGYLFSMFVAFGCAIVLSGQLIQQLNVYLSKSMYIDFAFIPYNIKIIIIMAMLDALIMFLAFRKQWRHRNAI